MRYLVLSLLLLFVITTPAQVETSTPQQNKQPGYFQDFLNYISDEPGMTRVDVFIQVPYSEIQFVLSGNRFIANYSISVSVFTENKQKLIVEKIWSEKLEAREFEQTTSRNNFNLSLRSFVLSPGRYFVRTAVEDKESSRKFTSENIFIVRDMNPAFSLSDILMLVRNPGTESNKKILPNISRNISVSTSGIPVYLEFYSDRQRNLTVEYSILDEEKKVISQTFETQNIDTGINKIFYSFKDTSLSLGSYSMYVSIKNEGGEKLNVNKSFTSRWAGIPHNIQDLDKAIQQMVYIATEDELDFIKEAGNKDDKVKRYLEFWKKKDPVPESEDNELFNEYYRRIEYANKNFSHYSEGWRTDRGMVFVILGTPNNVDRHPFDYNSKPYEIWEYYNLNRSFIFVDETGFGDYKLITPLYGDNYRFR
jgi:GWxTD domain-containing protein